MTSRARIGKLGILMLAIVLAQIALSSRPVSAADDYDSLRAEIVAANRSSSGLISLSGDIVLSAPLPAITGRVTIDGGGHSISGNDAQRIFDVNGGALTLSNVTLTGGKATESEGGAIRLRNGAVVTIERSTLSANSATHGGAIATSSGSDRLTISDSNFSGNIAEQSAGAIYANGGIVNIRAASFVKNCALYAFFTLNENVNSERRSVDDEGCHRVTYIRSHLDAEVQTHVDGGAIRLRNGARVSVEGSSFSENSATYGGAISAASKNVRLSVNRSSFVSNRASSSGGAIGAYWLGGGRIAISNSSFVKNTTEDGDGGAIEAGHGAFDIANTTFSENHAGSGGGALKIDADAEVTITHATFVENRTSRNQAKAISKTGGKAYLRNSIIASSGSGEDCVGVWDQNSGNLSPDGTCADRPSDNPLLGELTGSPAYYPLRNRSPAVDYADPAFCLETDQVGTPRPQGGGCDIGAIEARGALAAEPTPVPPLVCSLAEQIVAANRDRPAGGCPAGSGVDTIALEKDITLFAALPAITSHIIIEGNGFSISGDRNFRIFDVDGGILTVKNLTMMDGRGGRDYGGAIRLQNGGRATVSDSRFINNSAAYGGAVFIGWTGTDNSWLTVTGSHFESNSGSAIYAGGGAISVRNSSFVGNGGGSGGAISMVNPSARIDVVNSSFIKNRGGALYMENGATATLTHVTFFGNGSALDTRDDAFTTGGNFNLRNSIVVGRLSSQVCDNLKQNISNFIRDGSCSPALSGDPMLEEATDPAAHIELKPDSPAINAANPTFCPETDQLGRARSFVSRCDIGAIEAIPVSRAMSDCAVTTTHLLNFRDGPNGKIIGGVPQGATLSVKARTPRWFEVEHEGQSGWISAAYVVAQGECG